MKIIKRDGSIVEFNAEKIRIAIKKALDMINKDDVVLILGKGHEDYQIIGHDKIHLDDAEEVRKYIEEHK